MIKSQLVQEKPIRPAAHCLKAGYAGEHLRPEKREKISELHNFTPTISFNIVACEGDVRTHLRTPTRWFQRRTTPPTWAAVINTVITTVLLSWSQVVGNSDQTTVDETILWLSRGVISRSYRLVMGPRAEAAANARKEGSSRQRGGFYAAPVACWAAFLCISAWFHSNRPRCAWTGCLVTMEFLPQWMHLFIRFTSFKMLNALASTSEQDWSWIPLEKLVREKDRATVGVFCLPSPQTWARGNTGGCPTPQPPGRTCDSPSGYRPHTGAPLRHPVGTKHRHVWAYPHIFTHARGTIQVQESENRLYWYRCVYTNQRLNIGTNSVYTSSYLNSLQAADSSLSSCFFFFWLDTISADRILNY